MSKEMDPNTELFQCRIQWKKADKCREMWSKRWRWLLDENLKTVAECIALKQQSASLMSKVITKPLPKKSLKPIPQTTTGYIGWLSSRPDCQLEVYSNWMTKVPIKLPDAWEYKGYGVKTDKK